MFGLRKKPVRPDVAEIVVDEAAFAPGAALWDASSSLVYFVNAMLNDGLYRRDEIPAEAMWLHHADYYVAQVLNGGHSQFLQNSRLSDWTLSDAKQGLILIGAAAYAECLDETLAWAAAHPDEARAQDGFGTRADALDPIDKTFFAADKNDYYRRMRDWLAGSDIVRQVPRVQLGKALLHLIDTNPERAHRQRLAGVARLQHGLSDPVLALYRAAVANRSWENRPLKVVNLTAGFPVGHPTEEGGTVWGMQSSAGILAGYVTDSEVVLTIPTKENGFGPGPAVITARRDDVDASVAFSAQRPVAAVAIALVQRVNRTVQPTYLAPLVERPMADRRGASKMAYLCETTGDVIYTIWYADSGASIGPFPPGKQMASLKPKEIEQLACDVAAHNAYVPWR